MKRKIIIDPKFLRQQSEEVYSKEAQDIIKDLEDTLDLKSGMGLSAIQIGIPKKVGIIRVSSKKIFIDLINPEIIEKEGRFRFQQEGCLSIPGIRVDTSRYREITILNNGRRYCFDIEIDGIICIAIQHEISHMKGRTILEDKWRKRR